jgi:hypothetical protein
MNKKYIYCLCFTFFTSFWGFAQTLTPFVTEGNTWRLGGQSEPGAVVTENWKIQGDTTLSGVSYKNIFRDNVLQGFVRQTDKLVYFKQSIPSLAMLCDTQEVLLYNFNSTYGDTTNYTLCEQSGQYERQLITYGTQDSIYYFGAYRKSIAAGLQGIIEEIGDLAGPLHFLMLVPEWVPTVLCFNGIPIYSDSNECSSFTANPTQIKDNYWYSNPLEDNKIRLHTTQILAETGYKIYIYDNVGRLIFASQAEVRSILYEQKINAPDGLYYLVLKSKLGVSAGKFFLQN